MTLFLVRHAKAGSRAKWNGDDVLRPLSAAGREQTGAITEWLSAEIGPPSSAHEQHRPRLVSSPYARCVQTFEPLGARLGIEVETDDRLGEGGWFDKALALLDEVPDGSALCSHGDVISELIARLERRGMRIDGEPDWRKGSTWLIERSDGLYVSGRSAPPPALD